MCVCTVWYLLVGGGEFILKYMRVQEHDGHGETPWTPLSAARGPLRGALPRRNNKLQQQQSPLVDWTAATALSLPYIYGDDEGEGRHPTTTTQRRDDDPPPGQRQLDEEGKRADGGRVGRECVR